MKDLIRTLPLALAIAVSGALASPALAQDTSPDASAEEPPINPMELNMGENAPGEDEGPGSIYIDSTHGDWEVRCIRLEDGSDPCQLYQLLKDGNGNPVSEINVFPITDESSDAKAGATVVTPLETLLTAQLAMQIDSGGVKRYPFAWCSQIGCFARLGFTDEDLAGFKRGKEAKLFIVPVAAPDQRVTLSVSLTGFTAAYDAAVEKNTAE